MPVPAVTTSAAGSLQLLEDEDQHVRLYALNHLLAIVAQFWAEISDKLSYLELLADPLSKELPAEATPYAALLVSKLYYYVGELGEAVEFALRAGKAFAAEPQGEYRQTIIAGSIDRAIAETNSGAPIDPNLQSIIDTVLSHSTQDNGKLAIGLALSLRKLDAIESIFLASHTSPTESEHDEGLLRYVLSEAVSGSSGNDSWPEEFRTALFKLLLQLFSSNPNPDWFSITIIWLQLNDHQSCAKTLYRLLREGKKAEAFQIGFDLYEVAQPSFVDEMIYALKGEAQDVFPPVPGFSDLVLKVLKGDVVTEMRLNFLQKNNKTDMSILKVTKDSLEDRYSIYHSAITFTNAFASCGTTSDRFLRENLDWLGRASNWAKFSTTAALGLIHKGSWRNGMRVVRPYLPGGTVPNVYSEGGALFALGLIYAGHLHAMEEQQLETALTKGLEEGSPVVIQHGAALGLGVAALGSGSREMYEEIRSALYQDDATAGEAAGYGMGMVMIGTAADTALDEMLSYAGETQHEKIIRSLAVGIAFLMYGQREKADDVIARLMNGQDAILRYGAMFTIALAYAGTGNNAAVRRLLHVAVSDVSDDVRRAAVTALGFVLFRNHTQVPRVVQLLAESYNPHVRHGATLALGISCVGTGLEAAIDLLEPLTRDPVDFVRQGAYISLSLILLQAPDSHPKAQSTRDLLHKVVNDKHEDAMARFGASLAQGILDAGGRNVTISLSTRAGTLNMHAIVGLALFVQFWYWFPLAHGLGLAFTPTTVIALDEEMRIPKVSFRCDGKPSSFAYPIGKKEEKEKKTEKAKAAVLSTTVKAQARKKRQAGDVEMATSPNSPMTMTSPISLPTVNDTPNNIISSIDGVLTNSNESVEEKKSTVNMGMGENEVKGLGSSGKKEKDKDKISKKKESIGFKVENMTRVLPSQLDLLSFVNNEKYVPIRSLPIWVEDRSSENKSQLSQTQTQAQIGVNPQTRTSIKIESQGKDIKDVTKVDGKRWETGSIIVLRTIPDPTVDSKQKEEKEDEEEDDDDGEYINLDPRLWPELIMNEDDQSGEQGDGETLGEGDEEDEDDDDDEGEEGEEGDDEIPPSFEYPF
ncbi:26S proteasome regulatory subunit N2 [Tremella mesenterica]|uniref:26S proteasome regulatory subunit RPN2 n=1 Tax=Tremella mesenterica TaxID=5217 RepID=A0A4Q1BND8_TREME|nr:26S proteasome regulatory subunit N2 [Tremella mesenterica]